MTIRAPASVHDSPVQVMIALVFVLLCPTEAAADDAGSDPDDDRDLASADEPADPWHHQSILTEDLTVYRPNYFLPVAWSPDAPLDGTEKSTEAQFQISLQYRILRSPFYFTYTQTSFWQVYDGADSRPFRETNFNPQLFYRLRSERNPLGPFIVDVGWDHASNGQSWPLSRGWDRIYLRAERTTTDSRVALMLWHRLEPGREATEDNPSGDDNPDIIDFMGRHQLEYERRLFDGHRVSWMSRYNFSTGHGAARLRYSLPSGDEGFWFLQIFHGYGESLIDHDERLTRVGIGWAVSR